MAFVFGQETELGFEATGKSVSVPPNNIAKLMYYLNSASACLEDMVDNRWKDYNNYYNLDNQERRAVVALAVLISPDILVGKVFFAVESNSPVLNGFTNEFYTITEAKRVIAAATDFENTILVDGRSVSINKIMVVTSAWLESYFLEPLKAEIWRLDSDSEPKNQINSGSSYIPSYSSSTNFTTDAQYAVCFFCIGFCFGCCLWLCNLRYIRSSNKIAKGFSILSITLYCVVSAILLLGLILNFTAPNVFSLDTNY